MFCPLIDPPDSVILNKFRFNMNLLYVDMLVVVQKTPLRLQIF